MRLFELAEAAIKIGGKKNPAVDEFMAKYYKVTQKHPFDSSSRIAWDGKSTATVQPFPDYINLSAIQTLAPGERSGSANGLVMTLVALADETGVPVRLSAKPFGNMEGKLTKRQLIAWYKRKGFVSNSTGGSGMTYTPPVKENITERVSRSHPVIIVDVQPAYSSTPTARRDGYTGAARIAPELMSFLNAQTGPIIAYYNGAGEGFTEDTEYDVQSYFLENGLGDDQINKIQFIEKTYGFFRNWMDQEINPGLIIKILREMNRQRIWDSRELEPGLEELMQEGEYENWMEDDPINFPDINIAQLKSMSGALLCGGGQHECLKEIQLLMSVYNIRYKLAQDFIYG